MSFKTTLTVLIFLISSIHASASEIKVHNSRAQALLAQALAAPAARFENAYGIYRGYCVNAQGPEGETYVQSSALAITGRAVKGISQLVDNFGDDRLKGDRKYNLYSKQSLSDTQLVRALRDGISHPHYNVVNENRLTGEMAYGRGSAWSLLVTQRGSKLFTVSKVVDEHQLLGLFDICIYELVTKRP